METLTKIGELQKKETDLFPIVEETKQQLLLTLNRPLTYKEKRKIRKYKKKKWKTIYKTKTNINDVINPPKNKARIRKVSHRNNNYVKLWDWIHTDTDHLIAQVQWWVNDIINLKEANKEKHQLKHKLFWTELPHKQALMCLYSSMQVFNWVHAKMFLEELEELISFYLENEILYNEKCFRNPNFIPKSL